MKDDRETRALRRLVLKRARAELRLARLRKRVRSEDTHRKFRLGGIGALFAWDELTLDEMDRRARAVHRLAADESMYADLRARGQHFYAEHERRLAAASSDPSFASSDEVRAQRRRQIILGALMLRAGIVDVDPAVVTGAALVVDEESSTSMRS